MQARSADTKNVVLFFFSFLPYITYKKHNFRTSSIPGFDDGYKWIGVWLLSLWRGYVALWGVRGYRYNHNYTAIFNCFEPRISSIFIKMYRLMFKTCAAKPIDAAVCHFCSAL